MRECPCALQRALGRLGCLSLWALGPRVQGFGVVHIAGRLCMQLFKLKGKSLACCGLARVPECGLK